MSAIACVSILMCGVMFAKKTTNKPLKIAFVTVLATTGGFHIVGYPPFFEANNPKSTIEQAPVSNNNAHYNDIIENGLKPKIG